jgi:hypothetical protein
MGQKTAFYPKNIPNDLTGLCVHLIPLILSLQFFSLPIHIPSVLFLFRINPENDPNISISFMAKAMSVLELRNNVVSSAS